MISFSSSPGSHISGSPDRQERRDENHSPKKRSHNVFPKDSWLQRCNKTTDGSFWTITTGCKVDDAQ